MRDAAFALMLAEVVTLIAVNLAAGMIVAAVQLRHPQIWIALGRPRPWFVHWPLNPSSIRMQSYIFSAEFREASDARLSFWCDFFRLSMMLAVTGFAAVIAALFFWLMR